MIASRQPATDREVADHYDELDAFYREVWGDHVHHGLWLRGDESRQVAVRQMVERVAREALIAPGGQVVDIGCGYGATARLLAEEWGADVMAITVSPAQHRYAAELDPGRGNPRYRLGDWMKSDLPAESFDAAIAMESSEHMPDLSRFFAQAHRVLRPGGRLVVCAWLSTEQPTAHQVRWLLEPIAREGRMPQLGSETDYRRLARETGFEVEAFADLTRNVERTWPSIARIFLGKLLTRPAYLRFLLDRHARNRVFALTILRLCLAFRTRALRYGLFTFRRSWD